MRLIKMFGLAGLAAVAAMAFIGASSASAEFNTHLCKVHTSLSCPAGEGVGSVHQVLKTGTVGTLLNSTANVLCLNVLAEATADELLGTAPGGQMLTATAFTFTNCGTTSSHNNCTITAETLPLVDVLKTGLDEGVLTILSGDTRVKCTILGFIKIDCLYDGSGLEFAVTGGLPGTLVAENSPATLKSGGGLCPDESFLDGELVTLGATHIVS